MFCQQLPSLQWFRFRVWQCSWQLDVAELYVASLLSVNWRPVMPWNSRCATPLEKMDCYNYSWSPAPARDHGVYIYIFRAQVRKYLQDIRLGETQYQVSQLKRATSVFETAKAIKHDRQWSKDACITHVSSQKRQCDHTTGTWQLQCWDVLLSSDLTALSGDQRSGCIRTQCIRWWVSACYMHMCLFMCTCAVLDCRSCNQ